MDSKNSIVVDHRFVGYLCPVCIVRFPYSVKLAEHWSKFHCIFKDDLKTYPSLASAARRKREEKKSIPSPPPKAKVIIPPVSRKRQHPVIVLHNFQRRTVNEHVPQICQICDQIVWRHANFCRDCGHVCHLECHHVNASQCDFKMHGPAKSNGESTSNEQIGDIRTCKSSTLHIRRTAPTTRGKDGLETTELDMTYITDRLIAMTYPASGQETEYRTKLLDALKLLQTKHSENFRIINVSERRYDILQLNEPGQVIDYGWPDHLAPPLDKITQIISSIHYWLEGDIKNVAVIHCKGGKSRIGLVVSSYVQFSKNSPSPQGALDWFALRRYYDKKLDGAMHPSQKRYVGYYGDVLDKRLQVSATPLLFQNMILHGVPPYGNGSGLKFRMKIYQGYHLVHTTKTFYVPSDCDRFAVSFEDGVQLHGDIMLKCIEQGNISQNVIFRLQFHSDAVDGSVALFGKYDLDEAFTDHRFPDSSHIELIFAPNKKTSNYKGIFEKEKEMTTLDEKDPIYFPGPLDGNPYAQIDPTLKDRLRTRAQQNELNLQRGIEDLDGLLGDLGYTSTPTPDHNGNTYRSTITTSSPKYQKTSSMEGEITADQQSTLHCAPQPPAFKTRLGSTNSYDDVFNGQSASNTVNDLLFELDNSPLNSSNSMKIGAFKKKTNTSVYDNDFDGDSSDLLSENSRNDSVDGEMEIRPGTVAQHIQTLNNVLFQEASEYNQKYGVPLAGVNSPELVEQKITAFNSRSVAPGYCSPPANGVYHSHGSMKKVEYQRVEEEDGRHSLSLTDEENSCSIDPDYSSRMESLLSRSDSAYGESMRSSSPSPAVTPISTTSQRTVLSEGRPENNNDTSRDNNQFYTLDQQHQHAKQTVNGNHHQSNNHHHWQHEDEGIVRGELDRPYHHVQPNHHVQPYHHVQPNATNGHTTTTSIRVEQQVPRHDDRSYEENSRNVTTNSIRVEQQVPRHDDRSYEENRRNVTTNSIRVEQQVPRHDDRSYEENTHHISSSRHEVKKVPAYHQDTRSMQTTSNSYQISGATTNKNNVVQNGGDVVDTPVQRYHVKGLPKAELLLQTTSDSVVDTRKHENTRGGGGESKKRTLAVVEERIQSSQIQKEVECMNEDIFKNLIDEDFMKPAPQTHRMPISMPARTHNGRLTSVSTEEEIKTESRSNGVKMAPPAMPEPYQAPISPPCARRFPPLMEALKSNECNDAFGEHLIEQPYHRTRTLSNGSSCGSDDVTSPRSPCGSGRNTLRHRKFRSSGSSNSSISSGELFPEVVKYPSIKFQKDTMNLWYKPNISRDEATNMLKGREPGAFVVRDSQSYEGAFGLAVKVATPPPGVLQQVNGDITKIDLDSELVRHFLIEPSKKGVRLKGSNDEPAFPSLVALIYQHSMTKMALPVPLVIPDQDSVDGPRNGLRASGLSESQLLQKGAACNLVYLGAVKVDTLTGDGAVQYAMNKVTSPSVQLKTTTVNIKVNQQGVTLTDNHRRVFFRRHFPMGDVLHCGVDPKSRRVNLKTMVENVDREVGCFGVVVKKQANSAEHHCHVFAELEADQPASAVINFIHKAMRYSRV